jgi:large repetitive protein
MFASLRIARTLLAVSALALGGCTSLLGDFTYDPNGSGGTGPTVKQGDIVVLPVDGLVTSEQGTKATFTVVLVREPTAPVAIALASSNPNEGLVNPSVVLFTPENYKAPQMVQVTGVDDDKPDGPQKYTIQTSPATSEDKTYHTINPIDPEVTNIDDDTAGFTLMPPSGLTTTESAGEAKFTVQLNHAPTADVIVPLSSDNPAEGTVSPASLTFTSLNWNAPQTVTVTGVDDTAKDGPITYHVVTGMPTSADTNYSSINPPDEAIINQDNDTAGVVLSGATNLLTFETGMMTSFGVALSSPPTGDVTLGLASSDDSEGTVSPLSLTFTQMNWMAPQVVSVTGVDDTSADGDQPYFVQLSIQSSADGDYATFEPPDVPVTNVDDDSPGLILTPTGGLMTGEDLTGATFTVQLKSKPNANVVVDVTSSRMDEGIPTPASLTFTEMNWNAAQVVTVMGVNDDVADGSQSYVVHVTPNMTDTQDAQYLAVLPQDVMLSNTDDDTASVKVTPLDGLQTTEAGGTATFTIRLNSKPSAEVSIDLSSSNTAEGTVSPTKVTFTSDNWRSPQTVTVTGVDDHMQDGSPYYKINTGNAVSTDAGYSDHDVDNVQVQNLDNDSAGIRVEPKGVTLSTNEDGTSATFTVVLNSQPAAGTDVSFSSTSSDTGEGVASPGTLKFTGANWNAPQTVTVKGVNDDLDDGPQNYHVSFSTVTSGDPNYAGDKLKPLDVPVVNHDNDTANINLTGVAALQTTEKNAGTATFQVALASEPTASVRIGLSSSRTAEGTVSPASLTFTNLNWKSPQTVTVTGVDDKVADGPQQYFVIFAPATSTDKLYAGKVPAVANVTVSNLDDDSPGVRVKTPTPFVTSEPNLTTTFTVELNSQPTADVTVPLSSSKPSEGTVSPTSLTFTAANWNAPRTVTVTGADDKIQDGSQQYKISLGNATSSDGKYNGSFAQDLTISNIDDDTAMILVGPISGHTFEKNAGSATFTVRLQTQPTADVAVSFSSSDSTEGTVSPASATFNAVNWASPQTITVTGVDDKMQDADQPYRINIAPAVSKDGNYDKMVSMDVAVINNDDDTARITVSKISGNTSESGGTATFTIVLDTQPAADVTMGISSSNQAEGTVSDSSVTFTSANWASPKTITVTGVDDDSTADGSQTYSIAFAAAKSSDANYAGKQPVSLSLQNIDNDTANILVSTDHGSTSEDGDTMSFTVVLASKPKASVTIPISISSADSGEGTVSTSMLTFTTSNWAAKQGVTVTGKDDAVVDGPAVYTVLIDAPTSTDQAYADIDPEDISVTNFDNDLAGIVVAPALGNTSERGDTTTFSIRLRSQPTADVTIPVASSDKTEGTLTVTQVVLTASDWSTPHVVTVHGEDDDVQDDIQPYTIITGLASSKDKHYDQLVVGDVSLFNEDNDTAAFNVGPASGHTSESGISATFTVALNSQPTDDVSIPISSDNPNEGSLNGVTSVDFTTKNWATPQTITVYGVNDDVADGGIDYHIVLAKPITTDTNYQKKDPKDVLFTNDDDADSAALNIELPGSNMTGEAASADSVTFSVVLTSKPKAPVTLALVSSNEAEGIVTLPASGSLTFTASNWSKAQSVTVQGVDDAIVDMDQMYQIQIGPPDTTDPNYSALPAQFVNLLNVDDDVP